MVRARQWQLGQPAGHGLPSRSSSQSVSTAALLKAEYRSTAA